MQTRPQLQRTARPLIVLPSPPCRGPCCSRLQLLSLRRTVPSAHPCPTESRLVALPPWLGPLFRLTDLSVEGIRSATRPFGLLHAPHGHRHGPAAAFVAATPRAPPAAPMPSSPGTATPARRTTPAGPASQQPYVAQSSWVAQPDCPAEVQRRSRRQSHPLSTCTGAAGALHSTSRAWVTAAWHSSTCAGRTLTVLALSWQSSTSKRAQCALCWALTPATL